MHSEDLLNWFEFLAINQYAVCCVNYQYELHCINRFHWWFIVPSKCTQFVRRNVHSGRNCCTLRCEFYKHIDIYKIGFGGKYHCKIYINCFCFANVNEVISLHCHQFSFKFTHGLIVNVEVLLETRTWIVLAKVSIVVFCTLSKSKIWHLFCPICHPVILMRIWRSIICEKTFTWIDISSISWTSTPC